MVLPDASHASAHLPSHTASLAATPQANYPNAGRHFGRLIITSCVQSGGHPWVDECTTTDAAGRQYRSRAVKPSLRHKRDRRHGRALVIGWRR